jgi:hypothetical protein
MSGSAKSCLSKSAQAEPRNRQKAKISYSLESRTETFDFQPIVKLLLFIYVLLTIL